jgi:hypothetical protein
MEPATLTQQLAAAQRELRTSRERIAELERQVAEARNKQVKRFTCEYPMDGQIWCFELLAESHEDAERRVRRLCFAKIKGEVMAEIPATQGAGLLVRLACWWKNWRRVNA